MTAQLKQHRDQIDAIDEQVLKLVNERAQLARQIGALKDDGVIYRKYCAVCKPTTAALCLTKPLAIYFVR